MWDMADIFERIRIHFNSYRRFFPLYLCSIIQSLNPLVTQILNRNFIFLRVLLELTQQSQTAWALAAFTYNLGHPSFPLLTATCFTLDDCKFMPVLSSWKQTAFISFFFFFFTQLKAKSTNSIHTIKDPKAQPTYKGSLFLFLQLNSFLYFFFQESRGLLKYQRELF